MEPPDATPLSSSISEVDICKAIHPSLTALATSGPDGLRPQHLKDLTGSTSREGGQLLVKALVSLVTLILVGRTLSSIHPHFFGASLVALRKKDRGICPIAVRCTLRRLVAKCAAFHAILEMPELLAPQQLGFRVHRGVEAALHATQIYLHSLQPDKLS